MVTSNTYEWCAPGIESEKDFLQDFPVDDVSGMFDEYNAEGVFFCNDISTLDELTSELLNQQGIKSVLHSAIYDMGVMKGFIGFDDCHKQRAWNGEEIATLVYISRILSTFVLKKQISKALWRSYKNYTSMLDNMSGYIYVIDPQTYETLYVNKAIQDLGAQVGEKCHKIAFYSDTPCPDCPIKHIEVGATSANQEIYSLRTDRWVNASATKIDWADKQAILICCTDITKYKGENNL